jgi:hypothetical protein
MNRRERLMATLRGETVDRPAVSFYEINGTENTANDDPYNIYNDPSWHPLIDLAQEKTDRMVRCGAPYVPLDPDPLGEITEVESVEREGSQFSTRRMHAPGRTLTTRTRRDRDVNTVWTTEHLLKDVDDLKAYLELPLPEPAGDVQPQYVQRQEKELGDTGIVMLDTHDPLCEAAGLFDMAEYTVIAMTEQELFHQLLERITSTLLPRIEAVSKALPGRLWRICGPEYASPPYLPPHLFREYVCRYTQPMVEAIQRHGGYARIHSHGNLKDILDDIVSMNPDGLDPIEPPPQGDVELAYVRKHYGRNMVLFGNLEANDIENLPTDQFAEKIKRALAEGTAGEGRGFVLMPSACPYGRELPALAMRNYEKMIEIVEAL